MRNCTLRLPFLLCSVFFLTASIIVGCSRQHRNIEEESNLTESCIQSSLIKDYIRLDTLSRKLQQLAIDKNDSLLLARSLYFQGIYNYVPADVPARLERLKESKRILDRHPNDSLLMEIYNALGVYEMSYFRHYSQAANYISQARDIALRLKAERQVAIAEHNLSVIFIYLNDTLGIAYDQHLEKYARQHNDSTLLYISAIHCGIYYSTMHVSDSLAKSYADILHHTRYESYYHHILGNLAIQHKQYSAAIVHYDRAIHLNNSYDSHLNKAEALYQLKHYKESMAETKCADSIYNTCGENGPLARVSELYALNHAAMGNINAAYRWMCLYKNQSDSISKQKGVEMAAYYRTALNTEKKEQEIIRMGLDIKRLRTNTIVIVSSAVVIILIFFFFYRRQRQMYRKIVRQNKEYIQQESFLLSRIKDLEKEASTTSASNDASTGILQTSDDVHGPQSDPSPVEDPSGKQNVSSCDDELFTRIQHEVIEKEAYRDPSITRDILSERCGCCHTYLTGIIRQKTGMTYTQYMNSIRIKEAIRVLTRDEEISIRQLAQDLGFLSTKNFHVVFKQSVGMPPMTFRNMAKNSKSSEDDEE